MNSSHKGLSLAATLGGHSARIAKPEWSPDGNWLASGSDDGTIQLWSRADWSLVQVLASGDQVPVGRIAWSPDGNLLAAGGADGSVRIWNFKTAEVENCLFPAADKRIDWNPSGPEPLPLRSHRRALVRDVSWSRIGDLLAIASDDFTVMVWNVRSDHVADWYVGQDRVPCVAFSCRPNVGCWH
jgi:WD40 repeat protein